MCIGCKPGEPHLAVQIVTNTCRFKPTSEDLKEEVMRDSQTKKAKPKWWSRVKVVKWMRDNHAIDDKDLEFLLKKEEKKFCDGLLAAADCRGTQTAG